MIGRNIIYFVHGEHPTEENGLYRNNDENYDDELIQTIIGIVNVNGFGSTKGNDENLRYVLLTIVLIGFSCVI